MGGKEGVRGVPGGGWNFQEVLLSIYCVYVSVFKGVTV